MSKQLSYSEQLKHPNWQRRRLEILQRDEFTCQLCFDSESTLHVHHKHYIKGRMAWGYSDDELVTVCETCHETMHEQGEDVKTLLAKLRVDGPTSVGEACGLIAGWASQQIDKDFKVWSETSPYFFRLGEVAYLLDVFDFKSAGLETLRGLLEGASQAKRIRAISAMLDVLREG